MWGNNNLVTLYQKRADDPSLTFTNPLLSCGLSENKEFKEYKPLEATIISLLTKLDPKKGNAVSVYFRDLNTGRWFGINEEKGYSPASLLKVPVMIAFFKEAENDPSILTKKVFYDGKSVFSNSMEHYKSPHSISAGNYYTIDELISSMIQYSDNDAAGLLVDNINTNSLIEVMSDIGLKLPTKTGVDVQTDDYMTVKSYSYLFRLLYNSTYLNRTMSEKALRLLSYTDFSDGIVKGIPKNIPAVQKFGERSITDANTGAVSRELHDCGIVYYPKHPYLICIMTKGNDFDTLSSIISTISNVIYKTVDGQSN
jgi:beta-lactamase class A